MSGFLMNRRRMLWLVVAIAPFVAMGVARVTILSAVDEQERRNARLRQELPPLDAKISQVRELRTIIGEFLARRQIVEVLAGGSTPVIEILAELSKLPPGIALRSVRADGRRLVLEGEAASADQLSAALRRLSDSPLFEKPAVTSTRTDPQGRPEAFRIEAGIKTVRAVPSR